MGIPIQSVALFYCEGSSDKVYNVQLEAYGKGYRVHFQYGRRGAGLLDGDKITDAPFDKAQKVYDKLIAEKVAKGYTDDSSGKPGTYSGTVTPSKPKEKVSINHPNETDTGMAVKAKRRIQWEGSIFIPQQPLPIDEDEVEKYLKDDAWGAQEKHDGKHLAPRVTGKTVTATNKKGKECGYPTALEEAFLTAGEDMLTDGESIGNKLIAYDLLELNGKDLRAQGYLERYKLLCERKFGKAVKVSPLAIGFAEKSGLLCSLRANKREGIIFKRLAAPYSAGKGDDIVKFKFYAEASVIVAKGNEGKHSIGMEVIGNDGRVFVGNCTIPPKTALPTIGSVVEVRYLYAYPGGSLYQPNYKEPRNDVDVEECLITQLKYKSTEED